MNVHSNLECGKLYHPFGVLLINFVSFYNYCIPSGFFFFLDILFYDYFFIYRTKFDFQPQRAYLNVMNAYSNPECGKLYHTFGVLLINFVSFYNHCIPSGFFLDIFSYDYFFIYRTKFDFQPQRAYLNVMNAYSNPECVKLYHPFGVLLINFVSFYNHCIPSGFFLDIFSYDYFFIYRTKFDFQPQRAYLNVMNAYSNPECGKLYHPFGVLLINFVSFYNHCIPSGFFLDIFFYDYFFIYRTKFDFQSQRDVMIIAKYD